MLDHQQKGVDVAAKNPRYAMFWETLAHRMDDVQIVEDVATDEDLDALHELINRRND